MNDRAEDSYQRQGIINRLLDVWQRNPELRLSQLLLNTDINYHTEDYALIRAVEKFYSPSNG